MFLTSQICTEETAAEAALSPDTDIEEKRIKCLKTDTRRTQFEQPANNSIHRYNQFADLRPHDALWVKANFFVYHKCKMMESNEKAMAGTLSTAGNYDNDNLKPPVSHLRPTPLLL